jgi:EAL domain-containing protein (putative c-di-GMP-specific phosphodiesterase class I)
VLQELKEMGLKLSIDDFGTGYSSLSYLRQLSRVHKLKIDQFICAKHDRECPDDAAVTSTQSSTWQGACISQVIAEGVEREEQMLIPASQHGCDEVQGYYFSPPLAAADFAKPRCEARYRHWSGKTWTHSRRISRADRL